jgi:ribosomal-protein-alanine N-acetyltransferase
LCALSQIFRGNLKSAYVGYWIGAMFSRQGYMTEALGLLLSFAFGSLRLHRIEANIQPENAPSKALVTRIGFRKEGFSPRYLKLAGRWKDHERWAICREDWAR